MCVCVCVCVTEQWGFLTEGKIEGKKRERERKKEADTKKLPHERGAFSHLDSLDFTACSAAKPLKILFPLFLCALACECLQRLHGHMTVL